MHTQTENPEKHEDNFFTWGKPASDMEFRKLNAVGVNLVIALTQYPHEREIQTVARKHGIEIVVVQGGIEEQIAYTEFAERIAKLAKTHMDNGKKVAVCCKHGYFSKECIYPALRKIKGMPPLHPRRPSVIGLIPFDVKPMEKFSVRRHRK